MKAIEGKWRKQTGQYQVGENLYLNRICVGGYSWNTFRSRGSSEANQYAGAVSLPSLKNKNVFADTPKEIKVLIEKVVNSWFIEALAKPEGGK